MYFGRGDLDERRTVMLDQQIDGLEIELRGAIFDARLAAFRHRRGYPVAWQFEGRQHQMCVKALLDQQIGFEIWNLAKLQPASATIRIIALALSTVPLKLDPISPMMIAGSSGLFNRSATEAVISSIA